MGKVHAGNPAGAWAGVLDEAAKRLADIDPDAVVFQEDREDLRAEGGSRGVETTQSRTSGAAVRVAGASRSAFLSAARPEDLDALVASARTGALPAGLPAAGTPGPEPMLEGRRAGHIVRALIAAALTERGGPEIVSVRAGYAAMVQTVRVARPDLAAATDVRRGERIWIDVTVRSGDRLASGRGEMVLRPGREMRLENFARGVSQRAAARLCAVPIPSASCPAVFAPGVAGILIHEIVGHALEGDVVRRGASRLAEETTPIATPSVRVLDDPRRARVPWRIDDEGESARTISLVEGGRVSGVIHDRSSASASGESPTGHGRCASFRDRILPRMGCTFLAAGAAQPYDALEGVREGVFVRRMEAATVDPATGHAVFRVTDGDRIANGHLLDPVAPFLFAVSSVHLLRSIDAIAGDLDFDTCVGSCARDGQPLAISVGAPTCRLGAIKVLG